MGSTAMPRERAIAVDREVLPDVARRSCRRKAPGSASAAARAMPATSTSRRRAPSTSRRLRVLGRALDPSAIDEHRRVGAVDAKRRDHMEAGAPSRTWLSMKNWPSATQRPAARTRRKRMSAAGHGAPARSHRGLAHARLEQRLQRLLLVAAVRLPSAEPHRERDQRRGADRGPRRPARMRAADPHGAASPVARYVTLSRP